MTRPQPKLALVKGLPTETASFLDVITGSSQVTFATFDDQAARKRSSLSRMLHGLTTANATELHRLNDAGAGVYFSINETDGEGRTANHIIGTRTPSNCAALCPNCHRALHYATDREERLKVLQANMQKPRQGTPERAP